MDNEQQSKRFSRDVAIGLGTALILLVVFAFGMFVGEQKARFSYRWGENYHREFGGPRFGPPGGPKDFFGGHGAAGVVIKKTSGKLWLRSPDNAERVVLIDKDTYIVEGRQAIKANEIREGRGVVVVGAPDDKGRVKARLIRVFEGIPGKGPM